MIMDKGEIVREYKSAKDQKQMISILADLNCCSKEIIKDIIGIKGKKKVKSEQKIKLNEAETKSLYDRLDELDEAIKPLEDEYRRTVRMLLLTESW